MTLFKKRFPMFFLALLTSLYLIGHSTFSFAQGQYPNRPIKLIIPFPPAGPTDIFARQYAQALSNILNTPVITENKGGAAGVIGSVEAKRSTPDGYTLLFGTVTTHGLYNLLSNKPQYDSLTDFTHIAVIGEAPIAFAVNPSMPKTFKEFVELVKNNPTKYSYGSSGEGTFLHYAGERLKQSVGNFPIQHVPYRGSGASLPAVMAGEVSMTSDTLSTVINQHKSGNIRILGVASSKRFAIAPDVPTVSEALGLKDFQVMAWYEILAPTGLPQSIVNQLAIASDKALSDPALIEKLNSLSIQPTPGITGIKAAQFVKQDIEKLSVTIKTLGVRLD